MAFDIIPDGKPVEEPEEAAAAAYPKIPSTTGQVLGEEAASTVRQVARVGEQGAYAGSGILPRLLYGMGFSEAATAPAMAGEPALPAPGTMQSPMVPPDEYNKKYAPVGNDGKQVSLGDKPMPGAIAKLIGDAKTEEIQRNNVLARYQDAHSWPTNFAVSAAGFMLDPLRAATAFVPGIGEEAILARFGAGVLARAGARALAGGATGALSMAPLAALEYGLGQEEASDYGLRQAFRDIAFGAAGNAIIHAGITGPIGDILRYRRGEIQPGDLNAPEWQQAADIVSADAQKQHTALSTGVAELADGRPVDVTPIYPPPLRRPEPVEGFQFEEPTQLGGRRATIAEREAAAVPPLLMGQQRTVVERTIIEGPAVTPADVAAAQGNLYRDGFAPGVPTGELRQTAADIYEPPAPEEVIAPPVREAEAAKTPAAEPSPTATEPRTPARAATEAEQEVMAAQERLKQIEDNLLPDERTEIQAAQSGISKAETIAAAIEEAALCLKDTGL